MAAAAMLGSFAKKPFDPAAMMGLAPLPMGGKRERSRKNYGLHKQGIKRGRPSGALFLPHQGDRECARRLRQMQRDGLLGYAA